MNKSILKLAIPNIISNITIPLLGMVDMILMGHLESPVYLGGVGLGAVIFSVVYSSFGFLRMGTTGFTAQALGSGNKTEIIYPLYRSLTIGLAIAALLLLFQIPLEKLSFMLLNGSEETKSMARKYFYIRIWAAPATLSLFAIKGWFIGMQNTKIPMFIAILINVLNVIFNILFVVWLQMDVDGVALGTVLAQYGGLLVSLLILNRSYKSFFLKIEKKILFEIDKMKRFFKVNSDLFIRSLVLILTLSFFTSQSGKLGDDILAINTMIIQYFYVYSYFIDGIAYAGEALVGKFYGAGDEKQLKSAINHLLIWGAILCLPFVFLYGFGSPLLFRFVTNNTNLLLLAHDYRLWMALIPLTTFAAFIWDGIFTGAMASKALRNTILISTFVFFLPAWYFLTPIYGNHGLWIAFQLFMLSRGITMTLLAKKAVYTIKT